MYYLIHTFGPIAKGSKENCEKLMSKYPEEKKRMFVISIKEYNKLMK